MGGSLTYNYAAKQVNEQILKTLAELAEEQQLVEKYQELLDGAVINTGEKRMVLHQLTRSQLGKDVIADGVNKREFYKNEVKRIADFANDVHSGKLVNEKGEKYTSVCQIGIGGSDLGPRAMYLALENWAKKNNTFKMQAHFISNVDPDDAASVVKSLDISKTIFILVSKSGTTLETLTNESFVNDALRKAGLDPKDFGGPVNVAKAPEPAAPAPADPNTFTGTGDGFGGPGAITVSITLKDGKIIAAKAEGPKETDGIGSVAVANMPAAMVEKNSILVDGITGATFSSTGILKAAEEALKAAGLNPEDFKKAVSAHVAEEKEYTTDVAVIGGGGAGMVAAITAADSGKKVILVEKQAMLGGNSVRATGGMNAGHTSLQDSNKFTEEAGVEKTLKAAENFKDNKIISDLAKTVKAQWEAYKAKPEGYFDSVELMQLDTLIGGHGINDPELVRTLTSRTADAIDWLKTINIDLTSVGAFGGASVKRIHRPLNENKQVVSVGAYMIPRLEAACKARSNITIMTQTTATSLLDDKGTVTGLQAVSSNGDKITIHAKAVIIASGGFGANLKMVARLNPALDGFMTTNAPGIVGEGIVIAQELGAAVVDMKQIQIHPTVEANTAALITEGLRGDGAILVNSKGMRFYDETSTRDAVSAAEIAQPGSFSWLIVDQKMADASNVIKGYISRGYTKQGDTYEALAKEINVPADVFAKTMETWNGYVKERKDPDFNRTSFANPLDKAPYYAIKVTAGIHHTMGGLRIDTKAHVLKGNGKIIPGLFAAGEVTGGVHGGNRLGGNAVADFVIFGRIAGDSAAKF